MSNVTLEVCGRFYTVACEVGQEDHLTQLAQRIDAKLGELGANIPPQESQALLFAALFIADELHEVETSHTEEKTSWASRQQNVEVLENDARDAIAQKDALTLSIASLEQELETLKSSRQLDLDKVDDAQRELDAKSEEIALARETEKKLQLQVKVLEIDNVSLESRLSDTGNEQDALAAQTKRVIDLENNVSELQEQLEAALAVQQTSDAEAGTAGKIGHDLAPALAQFANLLENCADKLEQSAPAP